MKILFIAPIPFFHERGACIRTRNIVTAAGQLGHEVDVLTYPVGREVEIQNVRIIRVKSPFKPPLQAKMPASRWVTDFLLYRAALSMADKENYDCLICKTPMGRWIGRKVKEKTGLPMIIDVVEDTLGVLRLYSTRKLFGGPVLSRLIKFVLSNSFVEGFFVNLEKANYDSADVILANWDLVAEGVSRDSGRVCVLLYDTVPEFLEESPHGTKLREKLGITAEEKVLLYTGAFSPQQGIDIYLRCIQYLAFDDVRLVLVGPVTERYLKMAEELGVEERVIFTGPVPITEISPYYSMADVLLTAYETGGANATVKLLIYLFQGKPIVASDVPQYRQVVNEDVAFLAKPTPEDFASKINYILQNPEEGKCRALRAYEYAQRKFSRGVYMKKIEEILGRVERAKR